MSDHSEIVPADFAGLAEHDRFVRRLAARLVAASDADDVAQDAWVVALSRPRPANASLGAWLAGVVKTLARATRRKTAQALRETNRRDPRAELDPNAPAFDELPDVLVQRTEMEQGLLAAVLSLDEPRRSIVLLRFRGDLTSAAVGDRLGMPEGTVRWHLKAAIEELRARLDRKHGGRRAWSPLIGSLAATRDGSAATLPFLGAWIMNSKLLGSAAIAVALVLCVVWIEHDGSTTSVGSEAGDVAAVPANTTSATSSAPVERTKPAGEPAIGVAMAHALVVGGRCIDEDGSPLGDVVVRWRRPLQSNPSFGSSPTFDGATRSRTDGRFDFEATLVEGAPVEQEVKFDRADRVSRSICTLDPSRACVELGDVVLALGASVSGRVLDARGRPIAGAEVVAAQGGLDERSVAAFGIDGDDGAARSTSDAAGDFRLEGLRPGFVRVVAGASEYVHGISRLVPLAAGSHVAGIEVTLDDLGERRIEGTCLDAQAQPIPNAKILLHWSVGRSSSSRNVYADALGRIHLRTLDPVPHSIVLEHDGETAARPDVMPGTRDLVLQVGLRPRIVVAVRDVASGVAIADFHATVLSELQSSFSSGSAARRDPDVAGRASFARPESSFRVEVTAIGFAPLVLGPYSAPDAPTEIVAEMTRIAEPPKAEPLRCVVRAKGVPIAGARVVLIRTYGERGLGLRAGFLAREPSFDPRRPGRDVFTSDTDGRVELPRASSGSFYLHADAEGLVRSPAGPFGEGDQSTPDPIEIELEPAGSIEGLATTRSGRSVAGIIVGASFGFGRPRFTRTDAKGNFRFDAIPPGDWQVELRPADADGDPLARSYTYVPDTVIPSNCRVSPGATTHLDLALPEVSRPRIVGRVTADTLEHPGLRLTARRIDDRRTIEAAFARFDPPEPLVREPDGETLALADTSFELELPEPGTFRVAVQDLALGAGSHATVETIVDVRPGETRWDFALGFGRVTGDVGFPATAGRSPEGLHVAWRCLLSPSTLATGSGKCDATGRFLLESVPAGEVEVRVLRGWKRVTVRAGETAELSGSK